MNSKNSKTFYPRRLLLSLTNKLNLINLLRYQILAYTKEEKIQKSHIRTTNLKYQLHHGINSLNQEPYINYVGRGAGGFYKFFKNFFVAQETIDLNISRPSNFLTKNFMDPPINCSFLFKVYLQQYFGVVLSNIQISNHRRS